MTCPICTAQNEEILWQNDRLRVIAVHNEANAPAFCRVIWHDHIAEMTDLQPEQRDEIMHTVYRVEAAMRQVLQPEKINLASLGNIVPHVHWHVIARFKEDACFPASIWAQPVRETTFRLPEDWTAQVQALLNS
ncbi:HIT family protein [Kingella negevensis]|uniref:HIT domain protein n=1 Tax=Kingella negevensis TaxID=1522312 RepID=A0A238HJV2_9NEIS|nr:HIT family protein [Kingella negevensis]MDK4680402.1 HIT family protein [Kingella negevensis]MDK4681875.1 HIT family protein [Kingella negevensis]MDK4685607.1 HIT family protein [Kingella negevensis]MDK4690072.1 HIT family protein [Kingella negevensis]MDK4692582.1 HIT family protein [Kingella negevensis]